MLDIGVQRTDLLACRKQYYYILSLWPTLHVPVGEICDAESFLFTQRLMDVSEDVCAIQPASMGMKI